MYLPRVLAEARKVAPSARQAPIPTSVRRAFELLTHEKRRFSLEELASRVGVSKYHFARLFTLHIGVPPCQFQKERRLQAAALRLRAGARPIDVAYELGFADQSHLGRSFKRRFGLAPSDFARERSREAP